LTEALVTLSAASWAEGSSAITGEVKGTEGFRSIVNQKNPMDANKKAKI
jgi:hypothetical protein